MKQKDIALIVVVAFLSAMVSLVVSNLIFSSPKNRQQKVEVVDPISADFNLPNGDYFNAQSINPTQQITIGNSINQNPFNGQQ